MKAIIYSVRSERLLMEELDYNMLFRWFVGLNMDYRVWDAPNFTKNRERLTIFTCSATIHVLPHRPRPDQEGGNE